MLKKKRPFGSRQSWRKRMKTWGSVEKQPETIGDIHPMKPGAPPVQWKGKAKPSESMARCTLTATKPTGPVVLTTSNTSNTSGDLELTKISQTNYYELFKNYSCGAGMISLSGISGMEHQYFGPPKTIEEVEAIEFSTGCGGLSVGAVFPFSATIRVLLWRLEL